MDDKEHIFPSPAEVADILSAPEEDLLANLSPEEAAVAKKLLPIIADKANRQAEANKAKELDRVVQELKTMNERAITDELEKLRAANKPLEPAELEKLLSQEYVEYNIRLKVDNVVKEFVVSELPQAAELRFYRAIQKRIVPTLKQLASVEWSSTMTMAEKLADIVEVIPDAMETLAILCAVALDPFEKEKINPAWVQQNLSSHRILHIIEAQVEAGKYRDFFLTAFRLMPKM